ncbi:hypothetical protein EI982_01300 [Haloplanus rallus]|jgi:hypothetical protein|uniref:Uncharacterized protein n=1 Tax=Haloplanus rallus TaxID=1816183 RepID=A0A6B9FE56_9EURY|nr:hypothetical protein [Haloplanus rallus]QGX93523.1 hypothetical protein EI982_01300 [Haloplanus rallus]
MRSDSLPSALVAVGIGLLVLSAVPVGNAADTDYVHRIEPAENGTLAYGIEYDESAVLPHEDLSERGQRAVTRGVADSPYVVENASATAPEFRYTSDHVALNEGLYAVRYEGVVYSMRTERRSEGFNVATLALGLALSAVRPLGLLFVAAGLAVAGWRWYRD